ncbi:SUMO1 sentrin specific peptidase 8 [Xanthoria calcicola]
MTSAASHSAETVDEEQERSKSEVKANDASASATPTAQHPPSAPPILKRASTTSGVPNTSSANSPKPSRETSPIRPPLRSGISANSSNPRSRKNSTDLSPNRGPALPGPIVPAVPSAAAIQRALSVAGAHQLQPSTTLSDPAADPVRPQKVIKAALANSNQSASNLPRVRSPPPSTSNKGTLTPSKRPDQASTPSLTPSIVVDRPNQSQASGADTDLSSVDTPGPTGIRITSRGVSGSQSPLETVRESSLPSTPALGPATQQEVTAKATSEKRPERIEESSLEDGSAKDQTSRQESGNESGEGKNAPKEDEKDPKQQDLAKASAAVRPQVVHPKKSSTQLHPAKGKTGAEVKSMTVETETVSSIPQVALGGGAGERGLPGRTETGGSLRLKPSTETIRPKKDKKRVVRKAPSLNAGTASSKSDIFEAKVASAVDEANSSDSEETFVYESNPPEPSSARPHRYHSRTPSATSMASQIDHYGPRARQDGHHSVAGKKSMKFANNSYHSTIHPEVGETGTVRGPPSSRGTPSHHRHIGHFGRNGGHTSLFDNESPFPNATKPLRAQSGNAARLSPRPSSPRDPNLVKVSGSPRKAREPLSYDLEGEGADDEATPLIGSARSGRSRISRRVEAGSSRNGYPAEDEKRRRTCRAVTVYSSLATLMTALIAAVVIIMVFCSKPLMQVRIRDIRNVLASEQELMLDLHVGAINPNLVAVQVGDLDINIFAKSKHVGTNEMWKDQRYSRLLRSRAVAAAIADLPLTNSNSLTVRGTRRSIHTDDGIDQGTDPMPDNPETDSQTMLLGRIFEFDSPLVFEPSPLHHNSFSSLGEVRLAHPGNKTEEGGSARWEKVIQHDFELIVRGVVKYTLPLSSTKRKASVGASVVVKPGLGIDSETGSMIVVRPGDAYEPGTNTLLRESGRKWVLLGN